MGSRVGPNLLSGHVVILYALHYLMLVSEPRIVRRSVFPHAADNVPTTVKEFAASRLHLCLLRGLYTSSLSVFVIPIKSSWH